MSTPKTLAHSTIRAVATLLGAAALHACASDFGRGPYFPHGDEAKGREAFVALRCHVCHEVAGYAPPAPPIVAATRIKLGGQTTRVRTYEDLLTAIANPSHRLARGYPPDTVAADGVSLMSLIRLNDVMTVQQLVDLAAFLQSEYDVVPPPIKLDDVYPSDDPVLSVEP